MAQTVSDPPARGRVVVLVAEDDTTQLRGYARGLRQAGLSVVTARDGAEALDALARHGVDAIVTDITMPGVSGIDLLRAVRERGLQIPVILITGAPGIDTAVLAVEHAALRYLVKPIDIEHLAELVQRSAWLARMSRAREQIGGDLESSRQSVPPYQLGDRFGRALDGLWMAFQPILSANLGGTVAYEALLRTSESSFPHPAALLDAAERLERLPDLGATVRSRAAAAFGSAPPEAMLFVNLHASDLDDPDLFDADSPLAALAPRVVLELTERASLDGIAHVSEKVARLRSLGFRIAIDDLGAGYASLNSFAVVEPEFVKLDMCLVRGIDRQPRKQLIIGAIIEAARELGTSVVAEGVETLAEREGLQALGADLFQGFFFARPGASFAPAAWQGSGWPAGDA